jgi:hypothetical protein
VTEAELQAAITEICHLKGLWWFHPHDSRRSNSGWVDLAILGNGGALFAELKSEDGRRTMAQIRCADRITKAGLQYRLWRPADLKDGTIVKELQAIR